MASIATCFVERIAAVPVRHPAFDAVSAAFAAHAAIQASAVASVILAPMSRFLVASRRVKGFIDSRHQPARSMIRDMRRTVRVRTVAVRLAALILAAVALAFVANAIGSTNPRYILDSRTISSCSPGFDVAAHPEVLCYPVD